MEVQDKTDDQLAELESKLKKTSMGEPATNQDQHMEEGEVLEEVTEATVGSEEKLMLMRWLSRQINQGLPKDPALPALRSCTSSQALP